MIEVVVFGKPKSFESYAFDFGDSQVRETENSHHEPIVKPIDYNDIVFHYYQKDDIAGWEVYRRCKGYDAERPGIIFGVGIKSDKDFGLIDTMGNLLKPLWEDFAQAFLDKNYKFQFESIVNALKTTKWSPEEEEKVRNNVSKESIKTANQERPLLLLTIENPNEIKTIEDIIKEYNDVYIASNTDIFKNLINKDVLAKQANNEIYTVKDGKIGPLQESDPEKSTGKDEQNENKSWITWIWGGKSSNSSSTSASKESDKKNPKIPSKLIAAVATIAIIIVVAWFVSPKIVNKPADRIELAQPESGFVSNGFCLQPKLFHKESERTSTRIEDIKWSIEGDGGKYIEFDTLHTLLKINDKYRYEKPRTESSFIVIARIDEKELARKQYKLEEYKRPKANKATMKPYSSPIQQTFSIDLRLYYNDDSDVSTSKSEIQFDVQPRGIVCIKNDILFVENPPEKDTQITVTAYLDNESIGNQKYIIAKKADSSKSELQGTIYYKFGTNDFAPLTSSVIINTKNLPTAKFEVRDNNGNVLNEGKWHFSSKIYLKSTNDNPTRIDEIRESGKASLTYKKNGKEVATIQFNVEK